MEKQWSKSWKSSVQIRKQRKYQKKAPLHIKHKFLAAPLSKELKKEHSIRSLPVRKGDTVLIKTGQFKGTTGKVTKVSLGQTFVHVEGATLTKKDGASAFYPIHPSNVEISKLDLSDKKRAEKVASMNGGNN